MSVSPLYETRHGFARRLARYGYRPDTIRAALVNEYGGAIEMAAIVEMCRAAEVERTSYGQTWLNQKPAIGEENGSNHLSHEEEMEQGSAALLCQMWQAGFGREMPHAEAREHHLKWQNRTQRRAYEERMRQVQRLERELRKVSA